MDWLTFTAQVEITGVNPYIHVSKSQATQLRQEWRRPMPVLVQINGEPSPPWKINMMPMGNGSFYLYLAGIVRKASGTKVGDEVEVRVAFDPDYRSGPQHDIPPPMEEMLAKNHSAKTSWNALIPSRQKEVLRYIANLKNPETLQRNLEKLEQVLSGKNARFMAREWRDGK